MQTRTRFRAPGIRPFMLGFVATLATGALAMALQVQVVGGHALDANLRVDGSGFNTTSSRNRAPGLQSQAYRATGAGGHRALSSAAYRPTRNTSGMVDTRVSGANAFTLQTGAGTISGGIDPRTGRGAVGRADPLRVNTYNPLDPGIRVQRGSIPGGTATMRVNPRTGALTTPSMAMPGASLSGTK